jgi:glycosyltransferase involved in cell wall biosynthesis
MPVQKVSVIIPVLNEKMHIAQCLDSVIFGSYPHCLLEILVVDGKSHDGTREIVIEYASKYQFVKLIDNDKSTVSFGMNIGIANSIGEIVVRMDAHALYPSDYIEKLVFALEKYGADNVGGGINTVPISATKEAASIALIMSHRFGVGNSYFRTGLTEPRMVDTVPFGCYRRDVFDRIGMYDEMLIRNQDDELNARLSRVGGRIYLIPDVMVTYFARDSFRKMSKMFFQYGYFKPLVNVKTGSAATWRQFIPPLFVVSLLLTVVGGFALEGLWMVFAFILLLHGMAGSLASVSISRIRGWSLLPFLYAGFLLAHLSYGFGYLRGILDFVILRKHTYKNVIVSSSR